MSDKKREKQYSALVAGLTAPDARATPAEETSTPRKQKTEKAPDSKAESESVKSEPKEPSVKATVYIPKSLHRRVRVALADRDERLTLTDLLVDLLKDWADGQGSAR